MTAIIVTIVWLLGIAFFWALFHGANAESVHVEVGIETVAPATPEECPCVKVYDAETNTVIVKCHC